MVAHGPRLEVRRGRVRGETHLPVIGIEEAGFVHEPGVHPRLPRGVLGVAEVAVVVGVRGVIEGGDGAALAAVRVDVVAAEDGGGDRRLGGGAVRHAEADGVIRRTAGGRGNPVGGRVERDRARARQAGRPVLEQRQRLPDGRAARAPRGVLPDAPPPRRGRLGHGDVHLAERLGVAEREGLAGRAPGDAPRPAVGRRRHVVRLAVRRRLKDAPEPGHRLRRGAAAGEGRGLRHVVERRLAGEIGSRPRTVANSSAPRRTGSRGSSRRVGACPARRRRSPTGTAGWKRPGRRCRGAEPARRPPRWACRCRPVRRCGCWGSARARTERAPAREGGWRR